MAKKKAAPKRRPAADRTIRRKADPPPVSKNGARGNAPRSGKSSQLNERIAPAVQMATTSGQTPQTVVYIHGIDNKPLPSVLKCMWDRSLFGVPQHDRTRMAYWVNRDYYPTPYPGQCHDEDTVAQAANFPTPTEMMVMAASAGQTTGEVELTIESLSHGNPQKEAALRKLASDLRQPPPVVPPSEVGAMGVVPNLAWRWLTEKITASLLRDVNDFFYNPERREVMEKSLEKCLDETAGPHIVIAHSQGTMIAYNLLRRAPTGKYDIPLLITIGSPLGLPMVRAEFRKPQFLNTSAASFRAPACVRQWVNVAARYDIVCAKKELHELFTPRIIQDRTITNSEGWRNAHAATGYLRSKPVQDGVRAVVGAEFGQQAADFVVARDLVNDLHDASDERRHRVLIQLTEGADLAASHVAIEQVVQQIVAADSQRAKWRERCGYDPLRRFVSVELTRAEIEMLRRRALEGDLKQVQLDIKVWKNAEKMALVHQSCDTIQVRPAATSYLASGEGIHWAVIDTGVRADHPHFKSVTNIKPQNVVAQWDCFAAGSPILVWDCDGAVGKAKPEDLDPNGHGTHVAGVIAGDFGASLIYQPHSFDTPQDIRPRGMATHARIHSYAVLDRYGRGSDAAVIKALDHIAEINEKGAALTIHGVNLSLGGYFDPTMFGCGHSPLCQELRRLWRQGVIVVVAAGNTGRIPLVDANHNPVELNTMVSIGDPANLGDAIAVGSVHKTNPHMYGISFFSSRGPTMDGRIKPDCVAPGERILSARAAYKQPVTNKALDSYVELSGTSMAAPHVSGLIAAFLSIRREFIGYPDRVKQILKENCTDLERDRYVQGRGMPNLVRMLVKT